ncbi:MAG: Arm DNA-binding domain-containing protein [Marinobacter sp.]
MLRATSQFRWQAGVFIMAKARVRKDTNKLFIDFQYQGLRFREQTAASGYA